MKQILFLFAFLALAMTATGQTTYNDYREIYNSKSTQNTITSAIVAVANAIADQTAIANDSTFLSFAANILLTNNKDAFRERISEIGISRKINPNTLTEAQLVNGIRTLLIFEYWLRQFQSGQITAQQFYTNTQ